MNMNRGIDSCWPSDLGSTETLRIHNSETEEEKCIAQRKLKILGLYVITLDSVCTMKCSCEALKLPVPDPTSMKLNHGVSLHLCSHVRLLCSEQTLNGELFVFVGRQSIHLVLQLAAPGKLTHLVRCRLTMNIALR